MGGILRPAAEVSRSLPLPHPEYDARGDVLAGEGRAGSVYQGGLRAVLAGGWGPARTGCPTSSCPASRTARRSTWPTCAARPPCSTSGPRGAPTATARCRCAPTRWTGPGGSCGRCPVASSVSSRSSPIGGTGRIRRHRGASPRWSVAWVGARRRPRRRSGRRRQTSATPAPARHHRRARARPALGAALGDDRRPCHHRPGSAGHAPAGRSKGGRPKQCRPG